MCAVPQCLYHVSGRRGVDELCLCTLGKKYRHCITEWNHSGKRELETVLWVHADCMYTCTITRTHAHCGFHVYTYLISSTTSIMVSIVIIMYAYCMIVMALQPPASFMHVRPCACIYMYQECIKNGAGEEERVTSGI